MRGPSLIAIPIWRTVTIAIAVSVVLPTFAAAQPQPTLPELADRLDGLVRLYRTESIDRAVDGLAEFVVLKRSRAAAQRWFSVPEHPSADRRAQLEAGLMLYSESLGRIWANELHPYGPASPYIPTLIDLRERLRDLDGDSRFLRNWYLYWEAFGHAVVNRPLPPVLDFLDEALRAFPDDSDVLMTAGSRYELRWWFADENGHRDPRPSGAAHDGLLARARDYLRRGVAADPTHIEARLRLVRVLLELNDLDAASRAVATPHWSSPDPTMAYLASLFEGELRQRQGNYEAAVRAYESAIAKSAQAQSARVARAHLEHAIGSRAQAVAIVIEGVSASSTENDPWWVYVRGQLWHFDGHLRRLRLMVRR